MVSSSIIRSTSLPFVACAFSPAFSKSLKVLRISLWSLLSSTIASVDMALSSSGSSRSRELPLPGGRRFNPERGANHVDDSPHDLGQTEVLRREDRRDSHLAQTYGV